MAAKFDPYYTWLGIPPEDQPPDHYALLGVRQFESNPDVISNLTDQRMAHVKTFQTGPHGSDSQKLLNEIAAARVCLLNPKKRKPYDAKLRGEIASKTAPEALPVAEAPETIPQPPPALPLPPAAPPVAATQSDSVNEAFAFIAATARPVVARGDLAVKRAVQSRATQRARARWLFIAAPILGVLAVVAAIMIRNSQDTDKGDPAAAPKVASAAPAPVDQKPGSAHGSSNGKPSTAKPQTDGTGAGTTKEPSLATKPAPNPPPAPDVSPENPSSTAQSGGAGEAAVADMTKCVRWDFSGDLTHPSGHFERKLDKWLEFQNGTLIATYDEFRPTVESIDLFNPSGKMYMRLTATQSLLSKDRSEWHAFASGHPVAAMSVAPASTATSDVKFPLGEWVDVLRLVDTNSTMVVAGKWSRDGQEVSAESVVQSRIVIPVAVSGSYDVEVEFTRKTGSDCVCEMFPLGSHQCSLILSGWNGAASGLGGLDGRGADDPQNQASARPGNLENGHRYRLLVRVRVNSDGRGSLDTLLDGTPYLPHWEGDSAVLRPDPAGWMTPLGDRLAIGASSEVMFHSARLKMLSGSASLDPALTSVNVPSAAPPAGSGSAPNLSDSPPEKTAAGESWAARANALIQSGRSAKTAVDRAEVIRSSLKLFTQAEGADRWSSQALELVQLAENLGQQTKEGELITGSLQSAEERIRREKTIADGVTAAQDALAKNANDPSANTIVGRFLCLQMDNWEEGLPHLVKGSDFSLTKLANLERSSPSEPAAQLKLANSWWDMADKRSGLKPNPWLGPMRARAAYWYRKSASGLRGRELAMAQKRIAEQDAAAGELAALADGQFPLPLGQWIDVLRFVDTNSGMVVAGNWSRDGQEISVRPGAASRVAIPVVVNGSYDFELDFTRVSSTDVVDTMIPIGSHPCEVVVSGWLGRASGLQMVNGYEAIDPRNPIAVRPGNLGNGRRYRLLVSARIDSDDQASVDVSLDGRPYLPRWAGNPVTLSAPPNTSMPNPRGLGLGAWAGEFIFHSARLRMLSGSAALDSALIPANR